MKSPFTLILRLTFRYPQIGSDDHTGFKIKDGKIPIFMNIYETRQRKELGLYLADALISRFSDAIMTRSLIGSVSASKST